MVNRNIISTDHREICHIPVRFFGKIIFYFLVKKGKTYFWEYILVKRLGGPSILNTFKKETWIFRPSM